MTKENNVGLDNAEYGVDSRYKSKKERESDALALMQARLERMKNLSREEVIRARLLQLKLKMENFLEEPVYDGGNYFTEFLKTYIDTIYSKRNQFANDICITPVLLSQIINNHREPKDDFLLKLMIHSEKTFNNVCEFDEKIWYQIYFSEKICETMSNQNEWRPRIEKDINVSHSF
ncbi:MAG: hypothetical protein WEA58_05630 [Balneolaceae bacterium]